MSRNKTCSITIVLLFCIGCIIGAAQIPHTCQSSKVFDKLVFGYTDTLAFCLSPSGAHDPHVVIDVEINVNITVTEYTKTSFGTGYFTTMKRSLCSSDNFVDHYQMQPSSGQMATIKNTTQQQTGTSTGFLLSCYSDRGCVMTIEGYMCAYVVSFNTSSVSLT
ncbi:hypothetical protein CYY_009359 [Polysphondylium violaceum]|uniref:Uncharacterized protein n=1 Tax=Polysphondylium violaceum TaxID=133409 RepID=A0A8J4PLP3_9MYCE|nr:hypothetical protein CYY_009359 [Polysphondylium violaceum]